MKDCLFACDIDNTVIYSRKHPHDGFVCVEWIHEEEQAYMSPRTVSDLRQAVAGHLFVPVTSRSAGQYRRICFPAGCAPEWAVTACGADLLRSGGPDAAWREETESLIAQDRPELQRLYNLLVNDPRFIRCRIVDDAYLFVYCGKDVPPAETASVLQALTYIPVLASGKKIYLMPPQLNKGTAAERLKKRFCSGTLVSAGDSEMDLPMLDMSDCAIMPCTLFRQWKGHGRCEAAEGTALFSEFALEAGMAFLKENENR